jgi:DNA-binding NarL/FixJ family response regulator
MADKIRLGIYDELRITQEGICALLQTVEDIEIILKADFCDQLLGDLKSTLIHVLIINIHVFDAQITNLIMHIATAHSKVNILVISVNNDEEAVLKTIKAGAKGFLAKDTTRNELVEAVYSLRNGYDFFSNSITVLLLNKYIKKLKTDNERPDIRSLSSREVEIMKMWGNSFTNKEIADKLFLSVRTVETHKNHIMQKLNLKTSVDMVKFAIRNNIIDM